MKVQHVTIQVDGKYVTVASNEDIEDLSDAVYEELLRSCNAEEHKLGWCPLCADIQLDLGGVSERESRDYVSDLWGDWTSGWEATTSDQVKPLLSSKLVAAHKVVKSFIDTFAVGSLRFDVTFDPSISTAGTDLKRKKVIISPAPALDPTLDAAGAGTILTGMSVHEASHVRYDRNTSAAVERAWPDDLLAAGLSNVLADVRIERRFATEYPGFAHVFAPTLDYVGKAGNKRLGEWRPSLDRPVDVAVAALRYPGYAIWDGIEDERDWWQAWGDKWSKYDQPSKTVEAIREALAHAQKAADEQKQHEQSGPGGLKAKGQKGTSQNGSGAGTSEPDENPNDSESESKPSGGTGEGSSSSGDTGETAEGEQVQRGATGATLLPDSSIPVCVADAILEAAIINGADPNEITGQEAQNAVNDAATQVMAPNGMLGEVKTCRELPGTRRLSIPADSYVERAVRAALMRSRSGHTEIEHHQARGRCDNRSLARIALNDPRLFHRRKAPSPGRFNFWLLVDCSSSMSGYGAIDTPIAQTVSAAKSIASATRYASNVRMTIYGWTTAQWNAYTGFQTGIQWGAYRAWGTGESLERIGDLGRVRMGGTPDVPVLSWAVDAIQRDTESGETPVVVVLTDGAGYPPNKMAEIVEQARRKGVTVIGVSIGHGARDLEQVYGRGYAIPFRRTIRNSARPLGEAIAKMAGVR